MAGVAEIQKYRIALEAAVTFAVEETPAYFPMLIISPSRLAGKESDAAGGRSLLAEAEPQTVYLFVYDIAIEQIIIETPCFQFHSFSFMLDI